MALKPKLSPLLVEEPPPAIATALQALFHGRADEHQQRNAYEWIVRHAARCFSTTFDPDPVTSAFLQGRRQVGLIIQQATRTSAEAAAALEDIHKGNEP